MKTQLILLDNPIIVSDEIQVKGDYIIHKTLLDKITQAPDIYGSTQEHWYKVIAGLPGFPSINWNGLEEEFGYVDVEKLAKDLIPNEGTILHKQRCLDVMLGFKAAQQLKRFSLEDMKEIFYYGVNLTNDAWSNKRKSNYSVPDFHALGKKFAYELLSKPKVFDIEIEMEEKIHNDVVFEDGSFNKCPYYKIPKITNNQIKIIKKL